MTSATQARETWLNELATLMAPRFEELGYPLPKFRVSVGFTSAGKSTKVGAECWHSSASQDGRFEIFIAPQEADPMTIAAYLAHELNHAASGFKHKHKGLFATNMQALGFLRPFTASVPGDTFKAWVQPFLDQLGAFPHAALRLRGAVPKGEGADGAEGDGEDGEGGSSNQKKKQSTRLLKAACTHDVDGKPCGYTVRLSKKWALQFGACCPVHGAMEVEGLEDAQAEDEREGEDE
jgi:hypothetical protein